MKSGILDNNFNTSQVIDPNDLNFSGVEKINNDEKYGSPLEIGKTIVERGLGGLSLDLIPQVEAEILNNREEQEKRRQANPVVSGLSELGGAVIGLGKLGLAEKGAAGLTKLGLGETASRIGALGLEGAALTGGQSAIDQAFEDHDVVASKVLNDAGLGAVIGFGFGTLFNGVPKIFKKGANEALGEASLSEKSLFGEGSLPEGPSPGRPFGESTDDFEKNIIERNKKIKSEIGEQAFERPNREQLREDANLINPELQSPFDAFQIDAASSVEGASHPYNIEKGRINSELGQAIREDEAFKKNELTANNNQEIKDISPDTPLEINPIKAGEVAQEKISNIYQNEQQRLSDVFSKIDESNSSKIDPHLFLSLLNDESSGLVSKLINFKNLSINPYKPGAFDTLTKSAYDSIKPYLETALDYAKTNKSLSLKNLRDIYSLWGKEFREIAFSNPEAAKNIYPLRRQWLDTMTNLFEEGQEQRFPKSIETLWGTDKNFKGEKLENLIGHVMNEAAGYNDINLKQAYRDYAKNQNFKEFIEENYKIPLSEKGETFKVKSEKAPETFLSNIFKNSETIKDFRKRVGDSVFKETLKNYLGILVDASTTASENEFRSKAFLKSLDGNISLKSIMINDPELKPVYDRLLARTRLMTNLPDAAPANPSRSATVGEYLLQATNFFKNTDINKIPGKIVGAALEKGQEFVAGDPNRNLISKLSKQSKIDELQRFFNVSKDEAEKKQILQKIEQLKKSQDRTDSKVINSIKNIFGETKVNKLDEKLTLGTSSLIQNQKEKNQDFNKKYFQTILMSKNLEDNIERLGEQGEAALGPSFNQSFLNMMVNSIYFLESKRPKKNTNNSYLFQPETEPTNNEKEKFVRYFNAVNQPVAILNQIPSGRVQNEAIEALNAVHPKLYEEMKINVLNHLDINNVKVKNLPYQTKIGLAKFLGIPLDAAMGNLAQVQATLALPSPVNPNGLKIKGVKNLKLSDDRATRTERGQA